MKARKLTAMLLTLAMALSLLTVGAVAADASVSHGGVTVQFGDPNYTPTWPENLMSLDGSNGTYTAVYEGSDAASYYPDTLSLYADCGSTVLTLTGSGVKFATYEDTEETLHDSITTTANGSDLFTLKIQSAGTVTITGGSAPVTISFSEPKADTADDGATPAFVNGYLPLGQYAGGTSWGSVFTNYTNVAGIAANDAETKITSGYAAMGLSLGAPGGYIQLEFNGDGVENDPTNPYGIDFVVYGNPFVGNPEAASVQVSQNGTQWYELAGSRYYAQETMHNATLTYTKESDGIHYAINGVDKGVYKNVPAWWPETSEGYDGVAGVNSLFQGTKQVNGVTYSGNTITFTGLTLVKDSDVTNDYLFGYADVRNAGSTKDGTACNPYATAPGSGTASMLGGDGFDLSWAVDENGEPVKLENAKYVRIYTSAALDPNNLTALPTPGIFGETSAEVCGVFVAKGTGMGSAAAPTITIEGETPSALAEGVVATTTAVSDNQQILTITGLENYSDEFTLEVAGGTYVFMNGIATDSTDIALGDGETLVQVISQSGTAEPFITLVKLSA